MPKNHARKKALAQLKNSLGIRHSDAIALLDHPDAHEREILAGYVGTYSDITTYREAVDYLRQEQSDPGNRVMCERCGWTYSMVCPECAKGCGCEDGCTGWRHAEMQAATDDGDDDPYGWCGCPECGAGGGGDPYGECVCEEAV